MTHLRYNQSNNRLTVASRSRLARLDLRILSPSRPPLTTTRPLSREPRLVPYRDSKLTRVFQSYFSGHGRVSMIVNASQCASIFDETFHALRYSAVARKVYYPFPLYSSACLLLPPLLATSPSTCPILFLTHLHIPPFLLVLSSSPLLPSFFTAFSIFSFLPTFSNNALNSY